MHYCLSFFIILIVLIVSGCSTQQKYQLPAETSESTAGTLPETTRPIYNLTGYPLGTKEGYIDGCETAKRTSWAFKDLNRYESDGQYRMGWNDGFDLCKDKK